MRLIKQFHFLLAIYRSAWHYPSPSNLNYLWNFGSLILFVFVLQLLTGIFLAMHYVPHTDMAFNSVEHIMRDVNYGWFLRYWHANGASFFFLLVYLHIFRGLYYSSYSKPRELLWIVGVIIFLVMIITAFLGYVLPWGQMSYWAATVITNLVSTVPVIGVDILKWLWGGFSVSTVTLNRFFSLHYTLSFLILGLVLLHIVLLHEHGSNNPLGVSFKKYDDVPLMPYYLVKDIHGIVFCTYIMLVFMLAYPDYLGHPDNYIPANPQSTPAHIVPEWYFLPFYAILRSVPNKLLGVVLLLFAILILVIIPYYVKPICRSARFKLIGTFFFWVFIFNFFILFWVGGMPLEEPYLSLSKVSTFYYFAHFFIVLPAIEWLEGQYEKSVVK